MASGSGRGRVGTYRELEPVLDRFCHRPTTIFSVSPGDNEPDWEQMHIADALLEGRASTASKHVFQPFFETDPDLGCELPYDEASMEFHVHVIRTGETDWKRKYSVVRIHVGRVPPPDEKDVPAFACTMVSSYFLDLLGPLVPRQTVYELGEGIAKGVKVMIDRSRRYIFRMISTRSGSCDLSLEGTRSWRDYLPLKSADAPFGQTPPVRTGSPFKPEDYRW